MRLAPQSLPVIAANRQRGDRRVERRFMPHPRRQMERDIALTRNLGGHARKQIVDQAARQPDRFEIIAAAIAGDHGNPHFRHDL